MIARKDAKNLQIVLQGLMNYAIAPNTFAESLMEKAGYPMLDARREVHETFKERTNYFMQKLRDGTNCVKIAEQARIYIGLRLISHAKQDNMDYVPYMRKIVGKGGFISSLLSRLFR
ncbi:hypothetical protein D3C78_1156770 [compost metagenome]